MGNKGGKREAGRKEWRKEGRRRMMMVGGAKCGRRVYGRVSSQCNPLPAAEAGGLETHFPT